MCGTSRDRLVSTRFRLLQRVSCAQGTRMARTHVIEPTWDLGRFTSRTERVHPNACVHATREYLGEGVGRDDGKRWRLRFQLRQHDERRMVGGLADASARRTCRHWDRSPCDLGSARSEKKVALQHLRGARATQKALLPAPRAKTPAAPLLDWMESSTGSPKLRSEGTTPNSGLTNPSSKHKKALRTRQDLLQFHGGLETCLNHRLRLTHLRLRSSSVSTRSPVSDR